MYVLIYMYFELAYTIHSKSTSDFCSSKQVILNGYAHSEENSHGDETSLHRQYILTCVCPCGVFVNTCISDSVQQSTVHQSHALHTHTMSGPLFANCTVPTLPLKQAPQNSLHTHNDNWSL